MNLKEALGKIMYSKAGYRVAVAAPDEDSIMEMLEEAVNAGLIKVWLVGDAASIAHCLEGRNLPEGSFSIVHAGHHAVAERACKLVADGSVLMCMKTAFLYRPSNMRSIREKGDFPTNAGMVQKVRWPFMYLPRWPFGFLVLS